MSADRLRDLFATVRAEGRTAFLPFMTAGLPDPDRSPSVFGAIEGADAFEVGIPYSDPLMDGPTIQAAGQMALKAGTTLDRGLAIAGGVVETTGKPVIIMTYANVIFRVGPERFAAKAADIGASAVIVADLPIDEAGPIQAAVEAVGLGMVLFVAPTTDERRVAQIVAANPVFVYGVAELGVTGERKESGGHAARLSERVRALSDVPLVMGVGISTPEQASAMRPLADGVIVGSALVRSVLDAPDVDTALGDLALISRRIADALR